jgi:hypothetical protein
LRVSQDAERCRACPSAGKLECQNCCCSVWQMVEKLSHHCSGMPVPAISCVRWLILQVQWTRGLRPA